ncbi:MAG: ABC transporter substrate-binding protein, partial [Chloroflexi bacterium]|nr:ABC transporter substrate-binding protein [Chloroflexota bacterium]
MRTFGLASIVVLILGLTVVLMACAPAAPAPAPPTAAPKPAAEVAAPAPPTAAPKPAAEVAAPAPPTTAPKPAAEVAAPAPPTTAPKPAAPVAAPAAPTPVVPAKLEKVKLAVFRKGGAFAPFWFARDKGFYQAEGLDVEIVEVAPLLHAPGLVSGEIDYTAIALAGEVFTPIVAKGLPAKILMVTHAEAPWYVIGGPGVTTLNDLKGKAIGVNIGAITHMAVRAAMKDKGMDPDKDVTYVSLSSQDR